MNKIILARTMVVVLGFLCWLNSCQSAKPLEAEVRITLHEALPITLTKDEGATFITFYTEADYRRVFIEELKKTLALGKIIVDESNPQFSISLTHLSIQETTALDTVKDEKSKDNGKVFPLAEAKLKASGILLNLSNQQSIPWVVDKDKRERLTSFQSPSQMIKGENKDLSEYRKKDFDKTEFYALSGQCGQRAADAIIKQIRKQMQ